MEAGAGFEQFVGGGLEMLGIDVDEVELAIIRAAHELYWPPVATLLALDLSGVAAERDVDPSGPPPA